MMQPKLRVLTPGVRTGTAPLCARQPRPLLKWFQSTGSGAVTAERGASEKNGTLLHMEEGNNRVAQLRANTEDTTIKEMIEGNV